MNKRLLELVPKRYLCPYCGQWHNWDGPADKLLKWYDSDSWCSEHECEMFNEANAVNAGLYSFYFDKGMLNYNVDGVCGWGIDDESGSISIADMNESKEQPIVTFSFSAVIRGACESNCINCSSCIENCNFVKLGNGEEGEGIIITLGFEFDKDEYSKYVKMLRKRNGTNKATQATQAKEATTNKEEITMANNIFNGSMEFGFINDDNIASTLVGIAVKNCNTDSWRIYDKEKKEITDIGNLKIGNLPMYIMPTLDVKEGDLIKDDDEYYFVLEVQPNKTKTLQATTGEIKEVVPVKNILGLRCYSKVVAMSDKMNIGGKFDMEDMLLFSAIGSKNGYGTDDSNSMNQLLPFFLMKDKIGAEKDDMTMLMVMSMAAGGNCRDERNPMNQLLPFFLMKKLDGEDDDMTTMMVMSAMSGDDSTMANNPMAMYLMMKMLKEKKEAEPNEADEENDK